MLSCVNIDHVQPHHRSKADGRPHVIDHHFFEWSLEISEELRSSPRGIHQTHRDRFDRCRKPTPSRQSPSRSPEKCQLPFRCDANAEWRPANTPRLRIAPQARDQMPMQTNENNMTKRMMLRLSRSRDTRDYSISGEFFRTQAGFRRLARKSAYRLRADCVRSGSRYSGVANLV